MTTVLRYSEATQEERRDALDGYAEAQRDSERGAYLSIGQLQVAKMSRTFILGYRAYVADHPLQR